MCISALYICNTCEISGGMELVVGSAELKPSKRVRIRELREARGAREYYALILHLVGDSIREPT